MVRLLVSTTQDDGSNPSISTKGFSPITLAIEYKDTVRVIELFLCCHSNMVNLNTRVYRNNGEILSVFILMPNQN